MLVTTGAGNATFNGKVDGAQDLTVNSSGATAFKAAVGSVTPLKSLTTDAVGTSSFLSVTTTQVGGGTGNQALQDATVSLNGTYTTGGGSFVANSATADQTNLAGTVLVTTGAGNATFNGKVDGARPDGQQQRGDGLQGGGGERIPLKSLTTDAVGTGSFLSVTTTQVGGGTGNQALQDATVSLNGTYTTGGGSFVANSATADQTNLAGTVLVTTGAGNATFNGKVDGEDLTVNSSGATAFKAAVAVRTPLKSLTTDAVGTGSFLSVTTTQVGGGTGNQALQDATVSLNGTYATGGGSFVANSATADQTNLAGTVLVTTGAGNATFNGKVDGRKT